MKTFADKVMAFNKQLEFINTLPAGIRVMNPFKEDKKALDTATIFCKKYYNDNCRRHIIFGINPGRFGGGVTGVPFTDSKRLINICNINFAGRQTHEPSSVFVYDMINAFGGPEAFYKHFYINSLCPLGFISINKKNKEVNYNFYDNNDLTAAAFGFIISSIKKQIALGVYTDVCFCFGKGKNLKFFNKINNEYKFFDKIIALEHPRFIMQYKLKQKQFYIDKYLEAFAKII